MQPVAYPYTMLMIMKVFSLLSTFFVLVLVLHYLDSSLSEAVEYGVPCSLAKELEQTM